MNALTRKSEQWLPRDTIPSLEPDIFELVRQDNNALVVDTREPHDFATAFIPGAINYVPGKTGENYLGIISEKNRPLLLICECGSEAAVIDYFLQTTCKVLAYLAGGMDSYKRQNRQTDFIVTITPEQLADLEDDIQEKLIDVRNKAEFELEHVTGAEHLPIGAHVQTDSRQLYYVYSNYGYRAMMFISIMKAAGNNNFIQITGGLDAIKENGRFFLSSMFR